MSNPGMVISKEIKRAIEEAKELDEIARILNADLTRVLDVSNDIIKRYKEKPDSRLLDEQETWIRLSIRLLFTTIEATCFKLKQFALIGHQIRNKLLDPEDIKKLTEKNIDGSPFFLPTADNLKYALKMAADSVDKKYQIEYGKEWGIFLKLLERLNRLTHPKKKSDLAVSPADQNDAADTGIWFGKILRGLTDTIHGI